MPPVARLLGWLGLLPFLALALGGFISLPAIGRDPLWRTYAAIILSFMGGVQWGLAVGSSPGHPGAAQRYAVSVTPALVAWASLALPPAPSLSLLLLGFLALLAYDLWTVRSGAAPPWYARLRIQLTSVVSLCLAVGLVRGVG